MHADPLTWLSLVSAAAWVFLLFGRGGFWRARERLDEMPLYDGPWPAVTALVPARNEAEVIGATVGRLLSQDYPGPFRVIVVDDHSDDGTAAAAREAAAASDTPHALTVIGARPLEAGWAGKVWALSEGLDHAATGRPHRHLDGAGVRAGHDTDQVICRNLQQIPRPVDHFGQARLTLGGAMRARHEGVFQHLGRPSRRLRAGAG